MSVTNLFNKNHNELGSLDKDLILKTRGQVRIQFGKKFVNLLNSKGQLDVKVPTVEYIKQVESTDSITSNGFYYCNGVIMAYINGTILEFSTDSTIEEITKALELKADKTEIPTKTSQLENDSNFITDIGVESINGKKGKVIINIPESGEIPYATISEESTSVNIVVNLKGVSGLKNGLCMFVKNSTLDIDEGFGLSLNGSDTKPVFDNLLQSTTFSKDSVLLFVYDQNLSTNGGWICLKSSEVEVQCIENVEIDEITDN